MKAFSNFREIPDCDKYQFVEESPEGTIYRDPDSGERVAVLPANYVYDCTDGTYDYYRNRYTGKEIRFESEPDTPVCEPQIGIDYEAAFREIENILAEKISRTESFEYREGLSVSLYLIKTTLQKYGGGRQN